MLLRFSILSVIVFIDVIQLSLSIPINFRDDRISFLRALGKNISETLSPEINPCSDFFGYTCNKNPIARKMKLPNYKNSGEALERLLNDESNLTSTEMKLKNYIKSCKNYSEKNIKKFIREYNFPKSIGGWPAIDKNWNVDKFNVQSAIAELEANSVLTIIDQTFLINTKNFKRTYLIEVDDFDSIKGENVLAKLKNDLKDLGVQDPDDVIKDAIYVETECAEILNSIENKEDLLTDLSGLKTQIPEIDWDKQIQTIIDQKLQDSFPVEVKNVKAFQKIFSAISKMNPKILANYFFVSFVNSLPIIGDNNDLTEKCFMFAYNSMENVIAGIGLKNFLSKNDIDVLIEMINLSFTRDLNRMLNLYENVPNEIKLPEEDKIIASENYLSRFTEENLQKEFENIEIDERNFLENTYHLRKNDRKRYLRINPIKDSTKLDYIRAEITSLFAVNLYRFENQPTSIVYTDFGIELLEDFYSLVRRKNNIKSLKRECFNRQFSPLKLEEYMLPSIVKFQVTSKGYFDWIKHHQNIIDAENEIFKDFDLTSQKLLFITSIQESCDVKSKPELAKYISSLFSIQRRFAETFGCPLDNTNLSCFD